MVVRNNNGGRPLFIDELNKTIPADNKLYILPYAIAVKYKFALTPIQRSDTPPRSPDIISDNDISFMNIQKHLKTPRPLNLDDVQVLDIDSDLDGDDEDDEDEKEDITEVNSKSINTHTNTNDITTTNTYKRSRPANRGKGRGRRKIAN